MNRDEFIKMTCSSGYCDKKTAEVYSAGKDTFDEDDFIEVYRKYQAVLSRMAAERAMTHGRGFRTTKRYRNTREYGNQND